ncbi:MAG: D-alanine-D-alanine ligase [Flavobacteriales bacterium]|jgi:D-alanine-D-alanine ligase
MKYKNSHSKHKFFLSLQSVVKAFIAHQYYIPLGNKKRTHMKPIIALLEGGFTNEALISQQSADIIFDHIDHDKFNVYRVKIVSSGWSVLCNNKWIELNKADFSFELENKTIFFDGIFNMMHGTPGEDGKIQAFFDLLNIPYTGGGVLNMALTFNKKATTTVLGYEKFSVAKSISIRKNSAYNWSDLTSSLTLPLFVKPNTAGSSLGISKVKDWSALDDAIEKAFVQSDEVLVEEMIVGTEVTCGVIEYQGKTIALPVTEIVCKNDFFDYNAKYESESTEEITPARISDDLYTLIQKTSEKVYKVLNCKGFVRIDYIISKNIPYVIEVNAVPGMSSRSLVPQQLAYAKIDLGLYITDILERTLQESH